MKDGKEFARKHGKLLSLTVVLAVLGFGFLVFCGNVRIDTEELMNQPGTTLGWLTIGRYGLVLLKRILGLSTHHVIWSGILFFLFFCMGANLLTYSFYRFSEKEENYPYWVFILLYVTSGIWCYQIYFSLQQAEIAFAMFLVIGAANLAVEACFMSRGAGKWCRLIFALACLVIGLGSYQALVAYYVAICAAYFLLYVEHGWKEQTGPRTVWGGIVLLLAHFLVAYGLYSFIANRWFMAAGAYITAQRGWGRLAVAECLKNILRTIKNVLFMRGPENFSYFTIGVLLLILILVLEWRKRTEYTDRKNIWLRRVLWLLAVVVLCASPFLMVAYSGEMVVTRTQFALPVVAAFFGMYGCGKLQNYSGLGKKITRIAMALAVFVTISQIGYSWRLAYTDAVRYERDVARSEALVDRIEEVCGENPTVPVVFVGYQMPELKAGCIRTEMYGWSFYEWDYSQGNPTGATHRICGFIQASLGVKLNENATDEMRRVAVELAKEMSDFPGKGSVCMTDDMVVVRLSEVKE